MRQTRDRITELPSSEEGSGKASEFRRDEILKKPSVPVSNSQVTTIDGNLKSKTEKAPEPVEDPGDRKKVNISYSKVSLKE